VEGKRGKGVEVERGRHGHGHAMSGHLLVFPWHGLGVVVSRGQCQGRWWSRQGLV
jgi:hypothetical protein